MRYLILGAGPAGLTFANRLIENGMDDFLVLEKESTAGGLCRSADVDGAPLDIGGGHFLDVKREHVNRFLFRFMPRDEWNIFDRDSQIQVGKAYIHHPFEANIWEFSIDEQIEYLKSIALAGCNTGACQPEEFVKWIRWKLGNKIAEDYMLPYNKKMFGTDLNVLGTYWLEKLPDVSFEDTLRACLEHKAYAKQPGHAKFYYPKKYGYGELWLRMAQVLEKRIIYNRKVVSINAANHLVRTDDGSEYNADIIITTVPWNSFENIYGMPETLQKKVKDLKHISIRISYYSEDKDSTAHWIYYSDENIDYHRALVRKNFCAESRGYWTETNEVRTMKDAIGIYSYLNEYAYPLNTFSKPAIMKTLLEWSRDNGIYGLGRWGEHKHYNSDVTVEKAIQLADILATNK